MGKVISLLLTLTNMGTWSDKDLIKQPELEVESWIIG